MKGDVAPYAIFIVAVLGILLFMFLAITFNWAENILPKQANQFTCSAKLLNYCTEWWKKDRSFGGGRPYVYSDKDPKKCEGTIKISDAGPTPDECRKILGIQ